MPSSIFGHPLQIFLACLAAGEILSKPESRVQFEAPGYFYRGSKSYIGFADWEVGAGWGGTADAMTELRRLK
jgi:hypothetical protein